MKPMKCSPESTDPILPCACANIRRAARAVTHLYDQELSGTGLDATQFTIVMALSRTGEISQVEAENPKMLEDEIMQLAIWLLAETAVVPLTTFRDRKQAVGGLHETLKKRFS